MYTDKEVKALPNMSHLIAGKYIIDLVEQKHVEKVRSKKEKGWYVTPRVSRMKELWMPHDCYMVKGSFMVKTPATSCPNSFLQHFYTTKYASLLRKNDPINYNFLVDFDYESKSKTEVLVFSGSDMRTDIGRKKFAKIIASFLGKK